MKAGAAERQQIALDTQRADAIRKELSYYASAAALVPGPGKGTTEVLDRVLRDWALADLPSRE